MDISPWYHANFEDRLKGRYITLDHLDPLLKEYRNIFSIQQEGTSELGAPIESVTLGSGPIKVLAWSQMHGNESTTTKAVFDLLKLLSGRFGHEEYVNRFIDTYTFCVIPMLNPDGSKAYTRENSNGTDLNRDAIDRSQRESRVLWDVFERFQPDLCLNLHDQRTIYGLPNQIPATISFLAPSADMERSLTTARKEAMRKIIAMYHDLQGLLPGGIGRYDDAFNANCMGDAFQMQGVPTILFEAGHFPGDYERERTREMIFYALFSLFSTRSQQNVDHLEYFSIPENQKYFRDVCIHNVIVDGELTSLAIQYEEILENGKVVFIPVIDAIGTLGDLVGHVTIDGNNTEVLLNYQEKVLVGDNVSTIVDKNDQSVVIFSHI